MAYSFKLKTICGPGVDSLPSTDVAERPIRAWFEEASQNSISLRPLSASPVSGDPAVNGANLRMMIVGLLNNTRGEVARELALLFCRSWAGPGDAKLLGLMFDLDASDAYGRHKDENGIPREAAVVFIDPFVEKFPDDPTKQADAIAKTAIHEIGHVFNLVHDDKEGSFMNTGYNQLARFNQCDKLRLQNAGQDHPTFGPRHLPGLSPFIDAPSSNSDRPHGSATMLGLGLAISHHNLLPGDPLILHLTLTNALKDRKLRVMPRLDPGYADLQVWYTTPDGERLLYRPTQSYCDDNTTHTTLKPGQSIHNNPRVQLGRTGPCFIREGEYSIYVRFKARNGKRRMLLESNQESFRVRLPKTDLEAQAVRVLTQPRLASFIYHKGGPISVTQRRHLRELATADPALHATRHARYALARYARSKQAARDYLEGLVMYEPSLQESVERLRSR